MVKARTFYTKSLSFLIVFGFSIVMLLIGASFAYAEESQTGSTTRPKPPLSKVIKEQAKDDIRAIKASTSAQIQALKNLSRCETHLKNLQGIVSDGVWSQYQSDKLHGIVKNCEEFARLHNISWENATGTKKDIRASTTEAIKSLRDRQREAMAERQKELRLALARAYADRMLNRFNAAIERLDRLAERIQSRINKVKAAGGNASESEGKLGNAKNKIGEAKVAVDTLKLIIASTTASTTAQLMRKEEVRDATEDAREAIKDAHEALVEAITKLRGMSTATSTTATTTSN